MKSHALIVDMWISYMVTMMTDKKEKQQCCETCKKAEIHAATGKKICSIAWNLFLECARNDYIHWEGDDND